MRQDMIRAFDGKDWSEDGRLETRSGKGSTLEATEVVRALLPDLFRRLGVRVFLDAPCGDFHWMQHTDLSGVSYIGGDVASSIIEANTQRHAREGVRFELMDVTKTPLPRADLMLCRDCMMHLKDRYRKAFFRNFVASGIPWLLTTRHYNLVNLKLANNGGFRRFNPCAAPFGFPEPVENHIEEDTSATVEDPAEKAKRIRSLGLWSAEQVRATVEGWD